MAVRALRQTHEIVEAWNPGTELRALINECDVLDFSSGVVIDTSLLGQPL